MKKILKSAGYCSDGCQWSFCDFYRVQETGEHVLVHKKDGELYPNPIYKHYCDFFGAELGPDGCLRICNTVYGMNYEGRP